MEVFTIYCDRNPDIDDAVELAAELNVRTGDASAVMGRDAIEVFIEDQQPDAILKQFKDAGFGVEERT